MVLSRSEVTAVVVTRGDVDLEPVLETLNGFGEVIVASGPMQMYERYLAARRAQHDVIYTQDDDCTVDVDAVLAEYEPGRIACNVPDWKRPEYPGPVALVGWGACFDRSLVEFGRYMRRWGIDGLFLREADRVFTGTHDVKRIDVPFAHLPHAHGADRLGAQRDHLKYLAEIRQRIALA